VGVETDVVPGRVRPGAAGEAISTVGRAGFRRSVSGVFAVIAWNAGMRIRREKRNRSNDCYNEAFNGADCGNEMARILRPLS
jgi:hypothetical protein